MKIERLHPVTFLNKVYSDIDFMLDGTSKIDDLLSIIEGQKKVGFDFYEVFIEHDEYDYDRQYTRIAFYKIEEGK